MTPVLINGLVPAAGQSRRMQGVDKLLAEIDGQPLLRRSVLRLCAARVAHVVVVIDEHYPLRRECVEDLDVEILMISPATPAFGITLRAGAQAAGKSCDGLLLHLPDMPDITTDDINRLLAAHSPTRLIRAGTIDGCPGHPVLVPRCHFHHLAALTGDRGLGRTINKEELPTTLVPFAGTRSRRDLDTPEDWEDWEKQRPGTADATG